MIFLTIHAVSVSNLKEGLTDSMIIGSGMVFVHSIFALFDNIFAYFQFRKNENENINKTHILYSVISGGLFLEFQDNALPILLLSIVGIFIIVLIGSANLLV